MTKTFKTLQNGIKNSFKDYADLPFLDVNEEVFSYGQIGKECNSLAKEINRLAADDDRLVAVFGYRSKNTYVGIYGILFAGFAYMPLNPKDPAQRLGKRLKLSACKTLVLSEECVEAFEKIAEEVQKLNVLCLDDTEKCRSLKEQFPNHNFIFADEFDESETTEIKKAAPNDLAYLLFTSGSTGIPKGVKVSQANVCAYAYYCIEHYEVSPSDKVSQAPDVTFDLSVHDLYISILAGASLCVVPENAGMAPAKFIKEKEITFWTSVPSVAMFMRRMRMLKPNSYPKVRCSIFCGEALPQKIAEVWQEAMPNAFVENTYGPTEATVAITNYAWDSEKSPAECENGIVPLGKPFPSQRVKLLNEDFQAVKDGKSGEICLAGSQVTLGYFKDVENTADKFVTLEDEPSTIWYRTGDLGRINPENGILYYLGRIDDQIKIRGYRVELQEIDRVLREASKPNLAICVPVKGDAGTITKILGFVEGSEDNDLRREVLEACQSQLPEYMIPSEVNFVETIPVNANGKINRKGLIVTKKT